jgi:hypothetical protein
MLSNLFIIEQYLTFLESIPDLNNVIAITGNQLIPTLLK